MLCSLLKSTGIAGRPESYFREPDELTWAARWGILHDGAFDFAAYLRCAITAGSTPNGVLGVRVMWGTMERIVRDLARLSGAHVDGQHELLRRGFGSQVRFVHLRRDDAIGQAVSWARAEQTGYWHPGDVAAAPPRFDFEQIDALVRTVADHNRAWREWFDRIHATPLEIEYGQLSNDPLGTTRALLAHLGLSAADAGNLSGGARKQADHINAEWIARYRCMAGR